MSQAILNFQNELKNKLDYKASSKISPDTYLYKSFKFFDLYNNGYVGRSDFFKTIAKCGVVVDTHDMDEVFKYYNVKGDGNIYYKQFISNLLFSDVQSSEENSLQMSQSQLHQSKGYQQSNPQYKNQNEQFHTQSQHSVKNSQRSQKSSKLNSHLKESNINRIYNQCQTYQQVTDCIKKHLRQNGLTALLQLAVQLKASDKQKSHKINQNNISRILDYLTEGSINIIMRQFNANQRQQINYAQLVYSLKGQVQQPRQEQIDRAFNFLDRRNEREITIETLIENFKHGLYKSQLIRAVDLYSEFQGIDDGIFTDQDFLDFFGFLSLNFTSNQQFHNFIEKSFFDQDARSTTSSRSNRSRQFQQIKQPQQIKESPKQQIKNQPVQKPDFRKHKAQLIQENLSNQNSPQLDNFSSHQDEKKSSVSRRSELYSEAEKKSTTTSFYVKQVQMIVLRMKKRLASKGTKGYLIFQKNLRNVDTDQDSLISLDQLKKVVKDLKIDITTNQCNLLFDVFDPEGTNRISYSQLIYALKGKMTENRQQYFERVWNAIKLNDQYSSFANIRHALNFRGHPDIQTGRRYDDQIFRQIQETILLIQQLNETPRSQQISKQEFQQYFQNLSLSIRDDQLFQSVLQNFWKMHSKIKIEEMYAGSRKNTFDPSNQKAYLMDHHRYKVKGGTISSNAPFGTSNEPTSYFTEHRKL